MARFKKVRVVRRLRDAAAQNREPDGASRPTVPDAVESEPEAKFEEDPHLNRGCLGCTGATVLFFGILFLTLFLQRCNP